jgi:hypothetical protein
MKNSKLNLQKFQVSQLKSKNQIIGGNGVDGQGDTVLETRTHQTGQGISRNCPD